MWNCSSPSRKPREFKDTAISRHETLEKSHGRIETRTYTAVGAIDWLKERHAWVGLAGIVMVESSREIIGGKTEPETRFYITSLAADAARRGEAIRGHWGIESHHWVMDMVFRDDECRIRKSQRAGQLRDRQAHGEQPAAAEPPENSCASNAARRLGATEIPHSNFQCVIHTGIIVRALGREAPGVAVGQAADIEFVQVSVPPAHGGLYHGMHVGECCVEWHDEPPPDPWLDIVEGDKQLHGVEVTGACPSSAVSILSHAFPPNSLPRLALATAVGGCGCQQDDDARNIVHSWAPPSFFLP